MRFFTQIVNFGEIRQKVSTIHMRGTAAVVLVPGEVYRYFFVIKQQSLPFKQQTDSLRHKILI